MLQRSTNSRIGTAVTTAAWRHIYPAIQREWTRNKDVGEFVDSLYSGRKAQEQEDFSAKQSGHGKRTEELNYGVTMTESPFYTLSEQRAFRKVSTDWHRFLRFSSAWQVVDDGSLSKDTVEQRQEDVNFLQETRLKQTDIQKELQKLHGQDAKFRGIQQPVLEAIVARHPRLLAIMKTGAGKSLLFMLPAACSRDGTTVVIVPLISLQQDLMERCEAMGVPCATWQSSNPAHWAKIVLVTPEAAVEPAFHRFLNQKSTTGQLDRIVFDECHLILDATDEWRPKMREMKTLLSKATQILCLTATLPPREEPAFFQAVGIDKPSFLVFRESTVRANIHYHTLEYDVNEKDEAIVRTVAELKVRYLPLGQIVIYGSTVKEVKHVAEIVGCPAYHREAGTDDEKRQTLKGLKTGFEHIVVATSALGLGIDVPSIRAVIHTDIRRKARDYA